MQSLPMKNILIILVGGTPQVITETLYGCLSDNFAMPDQIKVITTAFGQNKIIESKLLGPDGKVAEFCHEFNVPLIPFSLEDIWVLQDDQGNVLEDARSISEHHLTADYIIDKVQEVTRVSSRTAYKQLSSTDLLSAENQNRKIESILTKQYEKQPGFRKIVLNKEPGTQNWRYAIEHDSYAVHASIAGGRKSMTFLLGYAMSLFGRAQDKVSHVLVDERVEKFGIPFFYPDKNGVFEYEDKNNETHIFEDVEVSLAELPLVRMSDNMPSVILDTKRSYSETVAIFDAIRNSPPKLELFAFKHPDAPQLKKPYLVKCSGYDAWLDAEAFAYLWGWCEYQEPVEKDDSVELSLKIASCYAMLLSGKEFDFTDQLEALNTFDSEIDEKIDAKNKKLEATKRWDYLTGKTNNKTKDVASILATEEISSLGGILGVIYDKYRNTLKKKLTDEIGEALATIYTPERIGKNEYDESIYAMPIPSSSIHIHRSL